MSQRGVVNRLGGGELPFILLINDEPSFNAVMGLILKLHGYGVRRAQSASQALETLKSFRPDLILADLLHSDFDALAMIRSIRADPRLREIPTVVVSTTCGPEARRAAEEAGADALIPRPFTSQELKQAIGPFLSPTAHPRD